MTVNFAPQFQFDSTVVFQDLSVPTGAGSKFSWNFGDGSAVSTEQFPTHEFPAFDTAFRVCLSITNKCGTQTFCDTVYIDSAHWGGSMYTKGIGSNSQTINPQNESGIQALFYPNPTFGNGILAYTIEDLFEKGELKFYDSFGKLVFETSINKASDQIKIPLESYSNGLYFYTLQTNTGAYVNGKIVKM
jgi:hypothetical protein